MSGCIVIYRSVSATLSIETTGLGRYDIACGGPLFVVSYYEVMAKSQHRLLGVHPSFDIAIDAAERIGREHGCEVIDLTIESTAPADRPAWAAPPP